MKRLTATFLILILATARLAAAQLPTDGTTQGPIAIYEGHPQFPQKQSYASANEWAFLDAQGHWCDPTSGPQISCTGDDPARLSHGHIGCQAPVYGVVDRDWTFWCSVKLFHLAGRLDRVDVGRGDFNSSIVWENNDTSPLIGNPTGLVQRNFRVTIPRQYWVDHGQLNTFSLIDAGILIRFDNGVMMNVSLHVPIWVRIDPTQPPKFFTPNTNATNYKLWPATSDMNVILPDGRQAGSHILRVNHYLPLKTVPIDAGGWVIPDMESGRYGSPQIAVQFPEFFLENVRDLNLHSFVPGVVMTRVDKILETGAQPGIVADMVINPAGLPVGLHVAALRWGSPPAPVPVSGFPTPPGNEDIQVLLTYPFTSGDAPPVDPDTDGDGVRDSKDRCPGTPSGTIVDQNGCPVVTPPTVDIPAAKAKLTEIEQAWASFKTLFDTLLQQLHAILFGGGL